MPFMYIQGLVDVRTYKELCKNNGYDAEEKKCIFIFPGNSSHHALGTTLFSIKAGGGLAAASAAIGTANYPTLSLPTTSMEQWSSDSRQQQIVREALADLYKALGAGYQFILPVRKHRDTNYFDLPLDPAELQLEPSFWGGIQAAANKPLANHYIKELNALSLFMSLPSAERDKQIQTEQDNPLYQAYVQGQTMTLDDRWLTPNVAVKKESAATGHEQARAEEAQRQLREQETQRRQREQEDQRQQQVDNKAPERTRHQDFIDDASRKLDRALGNLEERISAIEHHLTEAKDKADELLTALRNAKTKYISTIENVGVKISDANTAFEAECKMLIDEARPVLERDLSWGDYLTNLLKVIVNVIVLTLTFGQVSIFSPARSESILAVEETEKNLKPM